MTKNDFVHTVVTTLKQERSLRAGQTMFNVLCQMKPEIANKIRATENDPFYENNRIPAFLAVVDELWEDEGAMLTIWWENLNKRSR
jgi:hypothetical protein